MPILLIRLNALCFKVLKASLRMHHQALPIELRHVATSMIQLQDMFTSRRPKRETKKHFGLATLVLQTENETINALLYSKNKRLLLSDSVTSHTPLKIQRFTNMSDGQKLIINDMTKVSIANQSEYSFQYKPLDFKVSAIKEILESCEEWDTVCIRGKAVHLAEMTEVGGQKN